MDDIRLRNMVRAAKTTPYWQIVAGLKRACDDYLSEPSDETKSTVYFCALLENMHHHVANKPLAEGVNDMQHYHAMLKRIKEYKN